MYIFSAIPIPTKISKQNLWKKNVGNLLFWLRPVIKVAIFIIIVQKIMQENTESRNRDTQHMYTVFITKVAQQSSG